MNISKEDMLEKIEAWLHRSHECFFDRFAHDNINDMEWANWLKTKGFILKASEIISLLESGQIYMSQQLLYDIYPQYVYCEYEEQLIFNLTAYKKNLELMAEFLVTHSDYTEDVISFLDES